MSSLEQIQTIVEHFEKKLQLSFTEQELKSLPDYFKLKTVGKKQELISEGGSNQDLFFVTKGMLYSYQVSNEGEKHVLQFAYEDFWISDLLSFFSQEQAISYVESIESSELIYLSKADFEALCQSIPKLEKYFRILFQQAYIASQQRLHRNLTQDIAERYSWLFNQHPAILQRVPQYLIASYLGVQPQSLSRVKNELLKKG